MNIESRLYELIAKHFNKEIEEISPATSKDNIEDWDSLEHIKLMLEIEEEFKVKFSLEVIPQITNVKAIQDELGKFL
ncbi:MAG: acyl carrier protein [Ignavibacteria bacterium]|nr:acyl carrier protein [Ignavibacteria bacterium]